jgi:hypothetical protein
MKQVYMAINCIGLRIVRPIHWPVHGSSLFTFQDSRDIRGKPHAATPRLDSQSVQLRGNLAIVQAVPVKLHDAAYPFRRFRTETLVRACMPEDLTKLWLGHSTKTITDSYALGLQKDEEWRRKWCKKAGPGLSLVGLPGLQNVKPGVYAGGS